MLKLQCLLKPYLGGGFSLANARTFALGLVDLRAEMKRHGKLLSVFSLEYTLAPEAKVILIGGYRIFLMLPVPYSTQSSGRSVSSFEIDLSRTESCPDGRVCWR
jgi:hypothetical protein